MATEIEPLIMPFDPLWVTTSKRNPSDSAERRYFLLVEQALGAHR